MASHLRSLANTQRSPPAGSLRKAALTCVLPSLLYGAEVWYEGSSKIRRTASRNLEQVIATRQEHLLDEVESVINTTNRAILPVWRIAPNLTLYKEAGIPTAKIALDKIQLRFGQRLRTVNQDHPLTHRVARRPFPRGRGYGGLQPARTRIQRAARLLPRTPRPKILPKRHQPPPATLVDKGSKEETAKTFRAWLETVPDNDLIVYSDGSKGPTGAVGWGYVIYRAGRKVAEGKGRLGLAEVFDGEVEGARHGLRRACQINRNTQIHTCIDNTSVIQGLLGDAPASSQEAFLDFQQIAATARV